MNGHSNSTIDYFLISMVEGNIELKHSLSYEIIDITESNTITSEKEMSPSDSTSTIVFAASEDNLDITVEKLENNLVRKKHDDILIVPCLEEFAFESKFFSLNRKPVDVLYANEDFLMRLCLKTKSPFNLSIVDAFFISDPNIEEKSNQNCNFIKSDVPRGTVMENILILSPTNLTNAWLTKEKFRENVNEDASIIFKDRISKFVEQNDKIVADVAVTKDEDDPFSLKKKDQKLVDYNTTNDEKLNINECLNVAELLPNTAHKKGFINAKINVVQSKNSVDFGKKFGLYCIKWKRNNSNIVNESKFLIEGLGKKLIFFKAILFEIKMILDVIEPLINIYCTSPKMRVFVREFFTYKIVLKNPRSEILHLIAIMENSSSFMMSGHKQLSLTIFPNSEFELSYNLYALKSNFQQLPEIRFEIKNYTDDKILDDTTSSEGMANPELNKKQADLNELIERCLPKSIFVHPPNRKAV
jgi:trafficking protein particle complex subunit 11